MSIHVLSFPREGVQGSTVPPSSKDGGGDGYGGGDAYGGGGFGGGEGFEGGGGCGGGVYYVGGDQRPADLYIETYMLL